MPRWAERLVRVREQKAEQRVAAVAPRRVGPAARTVQRLRQEGLLAAPAPQPRAAPPRAEGLPEHVLPARAPAAAPAARLAAVPRRQGAAAGSCCGSAVEPAAGCSQPPRWALQRQPHAVGAGAGEAGLARRCGRVPAQPGGLRVPARACAALLRVLTQAPWLLERCCCYQELLWRQRRGPPAWSPWAVDQ